MKKKLFTIVEGSKATNRNLDADLLRVSYDNETRELTVTVTADGLYPSMRRIIDELETFMIEQEASKTFGVFENDQYRLVVK